MDLWPAGPDRFSIALPLMLQDSPMAEGYLTSNDTDGLRLLILALEEERAVISVQVCRFLMLMLS